jgi:hypothetical protein
VTSGSDPAVRRARAFLTVVAAIFIPVFALPLFVDPYWWGDVFGWDTGRHTDLTTYLGRCLGAVALAITLVALRAARDPAAHRGLFDVVALVGALLAVVHLRGAIEDSQPAVEHLETIFYAGFAVLAWWCKPPDPSVGQPRISSR